MKVNGSVYGTTASEMHFSLDITDVKLVTLLHNYLIVSAKSAFTHKQYTEAEELLHDANHLADRLNQYNTATAKGGTEQ